MPEPSELLLAYHSSDGWETVFMASAKPRLSVVQSRVLLLLALSVFINYVDRGNLSIAAPLLKDELGLSAWQLGVLLSSFFWTYAIFQLVSGWLVDRFNVNWVIAIGFFLWSWATVITGAARGFAFLLAVRLVLGVGESVAYPCYSKILAKHFPEHHRGFANSVIGAGLGFGPAFGTFVGGMLMARFGWRWFFIVFGVVSMLWLLPWLRWMPREQCIAVEEGHVAGLPDILRQRSAWGTFAAHFFGCYTFYFMIMWLPYYLVRERHFSLEGMAKIAGVAYLFMAASTLVCGWLSDRWIAAGATPTRVRKTFMEVGQVCAAVSLLLCVLAGPAASVALLILVSASMGMWISNLWAITQTLAGHHTAGRWTGIQNFVGNLAGVAAPALTGFVVQRTGQFFWPFAIATAFSLASAISWVFAVGPIEPVVWVQEEPVLLAKTSLSDTHPLEKIHPAA